MASLNINGKQSASKMLSQAITPLMETLETRRMLAAAPGTVQFLTDTDGDLVKVRVMNGGTVDPIATASRNVEVSGTNVNSVLAITVQRAPGGDGLVTLGEIRCYQPMLAINGPAATITHEISINDNNLAVSPANKVSINLGALSDVALYTGTINGQRISSFQLGDWSQMSSGQELNAPSIDTLIITGNSGEFMILGDTSTDANTFSVGSIIVGGTLGDIQATGRIGSITAGAISGQLQASSFGTIATGDATGSILATGAPGVSQSIGSISIGGSATGLSIATNQGAIGQISIAGGAVGLSVTSAKALGGLTVGDSLDASRIQTRNVLSSVRVGGMTDTDIQVGVAPSFAGIATSAANFANAGASLQSFVVTGIAGQPTAPWVSGANTISAPHAGMMKLRNLDAANSLQMYMLDPGSPTSVRYLDAADPTANFLWLPGNMMPAVLAAMLHDV